MERLLADPAENIYALPGDVLTLVEMPQTFAVLGATGQNAQVNFSAERITLAEALAKAGGLLDLPADPAGVISVPVRATCGRDRAQRSAIGYWAR
jgi:polysaccharide export outer membrane protein